MPPEISLAQFNRIASGSYNAGLVDFETQNGELTGNLTKVNNHRWKTSKNTVLLCASLLFYGYGEPSDILLMSGSILLNYTAGRLLGRFEGDKKKRRTVLIVCVAANLLLLGFFKYASLFVSTVKVLPVCSRVCPT